MDQNLTSLALALEQHDLNGGISDINSSTSINRLYSYNFKKKSNGPTESILKLGNMDNAYNSRSNLPEQLSAKVQELYGQISNKDKIVRSHGFKLFSNLFMTWLRGLNVEIDWSISFKKYIVFETDSNNLQDASICAKVNSNCKQNTVTHAQQVVATLLRLSLRCPFPDVRTECKNIISDIKENLNIFIPFVPDQVSRFIPNDHIQPVDNDDEQAYSLYVESFVNNCRLEHMVMVMALHPQYLHLFLETNFYLLQSKGVLSYQYRYYIAIMAAARHQCSYLIHLMEDQFLLNGGDKRWLSGLDHIPSKLRALSTLNKLLAHRPWLVTTQHIKDLLAADGLSRWQYPELAQAIVLLCHFHSVAIFCLGTGINMEIDDALAYSNDTSQKSPSGFSPQITPQTEQSNDIEVLMERMKQVEEGEEEITREELNRRFEKEKDEASHDLLPTGAMRSHNDEAHCSRYVIDPQFSYQDFAKRTASDVPTFRAQDYNWEDHAFFMVSNYHSDVADLLDEKFKKAYNLTYKTLASKDNVDTSSLRRAIWKYVHCMFGIMYDDYNYGEVNQLLERPLKMFIKTVSCFPEQTGHSVYDGFWKQFRHSEKVHIAIMLSESRLQVGLLYGMRALTQSMKDN